MELIDLLRIVRRWLWLIIAIVFVAELALWLGTQSEEPVYTATVRLQISTPQREEVAAYDQYRFNPRDEIAVTINNFIELLPNSEIRQRTISQLGLDDDDASYVLSAKRASDADFISMTVGARTPQLAAEIANTHISIAIAYYGELRARSTNAEKDLFARQLRLAESELADAEKTLADFRTQNGIYLLESQLATQQRLLEKLQLDRDQRLLDQATVTITPNGSNAPAIDSVGEVDKLIAERKKEMELFIALSPQYYLLVQNVDQARAVYEDILSNYKTAELTVTAVQAANFIQVIKPASAAAEPDSSWPKLAILVLVGSLGLGITLAFILQYFFKPADGAVPTGNYKTQLRGMKSNHKPLIISVEDQEPNSIPNQHDAVDTKSV
jgi:uncharacterized protein involved in exopolysaccharide biosynthesis